VLYPELTPYFMTHNDYSRYRIVLLFLGQLNMYKLRRWRHEIYDILWEFSCLDYPLNVSVPWIHKLNLYN